MLSLARQLERMLSITACAFALPVCVAILGCASNGAERVSSGADVSTASDISEHEAVVERMVRRHIESVGTEADRQDAKLVFDRPYYFREYNAYPDGTDGFTVDIQRRESRTTPLEAQVELERERYTTDPTRKKKDAKDDAFFVRHVGTETITYAYENGRWKRTGSLFVTGPEQLQVAGEWRTPEYDEPILPEVTQPPEDRGFFRRMWSAVSGR